jgi:putative transcriptional regulator
MSIPWPQFDAKWTPMGYRDSYNRGMEIEPVLIGERIAELRRRVGMTQAALGEMVGVSQATISETENGRNPNVDAWIVARLAAALDTTMDYLLNLTDDPSPRPESRLAMGEALRRVLLLPPPARDALVEFLRMIQTAAQSDEQSECTR